MGDLFLLSEAQMARISPYFPLSHGAPRVDDQCVVSGIVYVIKHGLKWKDAPKEYGAVKEALQPFHLSPPNRSVTRSVGLHLLRPISDWTEPGLNDPFRTGPVPNNALPTIRQTFMGEHLDKTIDLSLQHGLVAPLLSQSPSTGQK